MRLERSYCNSYQFIWSWLQSSLVVVQNTWQSQIPSAPLHRPRVHLAVLSQAISAGQTYNRPESHSHISAKSSAHHSNDPILRPSAGPMSWLITTTLMISVAKGCVQGAAKLCCTSKGIGLANLFLHPISTSNQCSRVFRLFAQKIAPPTPSPKSHQPGATDRLDLYKLGRFFGSPGLRDPACANKVIQVYFTTSCRSCWCKGIRTSSIDVVNVFLKKTDWRSLKVSKLLWGKVKDQKNRRL